jgi:RHS repeat-associated protein
MVEQIDSEHYEEWSGNNATNQLEKSEELYQKPVLTKTWFHTGAFLNRERILNHFKDEYWNEEYNKQFPLTPLSITEPELLDAQLSDTIKALVGDEYREALRACKGMMLRQEVFALDASDNPTYEELQLQMKPYSVATHNCNIQLLQPRKDNQYGVFIVTESEAITISYERDETDYRIAHTLNTKIDDLGNILESASVVYGRNQAKADTDFQSLSDNITDFSEDVLNNNAVQKTQLQNAFTNNIQAAKDEQTKTHIIYTQNSLAKYKVGVTDFDDIDLPHAYRLRLPYEAKTYELTGFSKANDLFELSELEDALSAATEIGYHEIAVGATKSRLIEHVKTKYLADDLTTLDFGYFDTLGLPYESYQLAYTPDLVTDIYSKQDGTELQADGANVSSFIKTKGNFTEFNNDGLLWIRSGFTHFKENGGEAMANVHSRFFSPLAFEDPYGAITSVKYDTETITAGTRNNDGYYLFIKETTDAIDNKVQIDVFNYRTMLPSRMIDLNANPSSVLTDELGLVKALAVEGNGVFSDATRTTVTIQKAADNLDGLKEYTEAADTNNITQFFGSATNSSTNTNQLIATGYNLLLQATACFVYDFEAYQNTGNQPTVVATITREEHFADNNASKLQFSFEYSDGLGNVAMTKVQAEPGDAFYIDANGDKQPKNTGTDLRWVGNGRTVLNNKGNPVKQYEPYFSTNFLYEDSPKLVEIGVTPVLHYDSLGRLIKTVFPNGTLARVEFDSWKQINFDQNDTVEEAECLWYLRRTDNTRSDFINDAKEQRAASEAQKHANTPSSLYLDSLGRPVLSVANNGKDGNNKDRLYTTFIQLDIEGNAKVVKDARDNTVMSYKYDMLGHRVYQNSMDAGERWVLNNLMGNPIHRWDSRNHVFTFTYDEVQRPESIKVKGGDGAALDNIYEYIEYGENKADQYQNNLRGQVFQQYDTAGRIQNLQFDFKGNILNTTREFNSKYKDIPNWITANRNVPSFDPDLTTYTSQIEYDALNRAIKTISPDNSITIPVFNEAGLLEQIKVTQTGIAEKLFVKNIDYDAKGQREKIIYGDKDNNNLATTTYEYDEETFRLIHLKTTKPNGDVLQDLLYTYDPIGNITEIEDKAIPVKFFNNQKIEGKASYSYDALYRLEEAIGREHAGQAINFGQCDNWQDKAFLKSYSSGDDMAFRNYTQRYTYDPVGNILEMNHNANGGSWKRTYGYEAQNNRLKKTTVGGQTYIYPHHAEHGFIESLPHLSKMEWNFKDELQAVAKQVVCNDNNPPETTYYVYDASGQRVRKVTEVNGGGSKKEERLYLGVIEIYKKHAGSNNGLERITLHIIDDTRRIAIVDTRNNINDNTDQRTVRFQFSNHLGSATLELDDSGAIISYEEYHPYGTTAYQAINQSIKTKAKRYKYSGKERDEETGLYYYGARYGIPWIGRWLKPDPEGIIDGANLFQFGRSNPIKYVDVNGNQCNPANASCPQEEGQVKSEDTNSCIDTNQCGESQTDNENPSGAGSIGPLGSNLSKAGQGVLIHKVIGGGASPTPNMSRSRHILSSLGKVGKQAGNSVLLNNISNTKLQQLYNEALAKGVKDGIVELKNGQKWYVRASDGKFYPVKGPGIVQLTSQELKLLGQLKSQLSKLAPDEALSNFAKGMKGQNIKVSSNLEQALIKLGEIKGVSADKLAKTVAPFAETASGVSAEAKAAAAIKVGGKAFRYVKFGGRLLLVVGIAFDAYEIYESDFSPKVITKKAGAWGGSLAAGGVAAEWASPLLGGGPYGWAGYGIIVGGAAVGGYFLGGEVTETIYEWTFEKL